MKKLVQFVCLVITISTMSCSSTEELMTKNKDVNYTSISHAPKSDDDNKSEDEKKQEEEEKKKQEQEKLKEYTVYADALSAAAGTLLSGGNIGVGLLEGAVSSIEFYLGGLVTLDMTEEETYKNNPFVINPLHPINIVGIDLDYPLTTEYAAVGEGHNAIIRNMYTSEVFGTATKYELYEKAYYTAADMFPKYFEKDIDITKQYEKMMQHAESEQKEQQEYLDDIYEYLFLTPIEVTQNFINELINKDTTSTKCYSACLSTAYASRCLWNTIAPDPHIAQEGLLYDIQSNSLHYLSSREEVYDALYSNIKDILILFPCYENDKLINLYLYNGHFGVKPNIEKIPELIHLSYDVKYDTNDHTTISIEAGEYAIRPTIFDDTYYIFMQ